MKRIDSLLIVFLAVFVSLSSPLFVWAQDGDTSVSDIMDQKELTLYARNLEALLNAYPISEEGTGRLIVKTGELPSMKALGEVDRVYKGDDYIIIQFASQEEARACKKCLADQGYKVFWDQILDIKPEAFSEGDGHLSRNPESMNLVDLGNYLEDKSLEQGANLPERQSVVVGIIDTGINVSAFPDRVKEGIYTLQDQDGSVEDSELTRDEFGHGTAVASVVLDQASDYVSVMPVKVYNDQGKTSSLAVDLGLTYAASHCDVINMSMGVHSKNAATMDFLNETIDSALNNKIPVVVSAGNDQSDTIYEYPACYEPCWTVGAVTDGMEIAEYSNVGMIDFVAYEECLIGKDEEGQNIYEIGTSFSTPAIAGLAAELKSYHPEWSSEEIYQTIKEMCIDLGEPGKDDIYGYGFPRVDHAYRLDQFIWSEDHSQAKAHYACPNHKTAGQDKPLEISTETVKQPDCIHEGILEKRVWAPEVLLNGKTEFGLETVGDQDPAEEDSRLVQREDMVQLPIPALGHSFETSLTKASFVKDGLEVTTCKACAYVKSRTVIKKVQSINLSKSRLVYNGSRRVPTITLKNSAGNTINQSAYKLTYPAASKKVGTYKVTISLKGNYTGSRTKSYQIIPKSTSFESVSIKSGQAVIRWKRNSQVSGYQVQYAGNSAYSKGLNTRLITANKTLSCKLKNLKKGKKYYLRIRTFKTVNGKRIYSVWSKSRLIKAL